MLTKEFIETRKLERNDKFFAEVLGPTSDEQKLLFVLEKLGKLPRDLSLKMNLDPSQVNLSPEACLNHSL